MRPRKKVLLYCADELQLSMTAFVLGSRREYAVTQCGSRVDVDEALAAAAFETAIVMESIGDLDHGESIVIAAKSVRGDLPVVLDLRRPTVTQTIADRVVVHEMAALLEALHVVCSRRRGPRKALVVEPGCEPMQQPRMAVA